MATPVLRIATLLTVTLCLAPAGRAADSKVATPAGLLAKGTPAETPWFIKDSGQPGPIVFISGGVHGDEPAGAAAATAILDWPIAKGKLVLLPRANVVALAAKKRNTPGFSTNLSNLNRNFPRAGTNEPPRGALATEIWELVRSQKPDWLLDLHEGFDFNIANTNSVGSSVIAHPAKDGRKIARLMLDAVNATIADDNRKFNLRGPPVDSSLARGAAEHLGCGAMICETTTKGQPLDKRVAQHHLMVRTFLLHLGVMTADAKPAEKSAAAPSTVLTLVALYDSDGSFGKGVPRVTEQLGKVAGVRVVTFKPDDFRAGKLDGHRVVIFTGGSGSKQAAAIGEDGRARVRKFVEDGGGYLGICAGAYLACDGFSWGVKVLDAKTVSSKWQRGKGDVTMELTDSGRELFGDKRGAFNVRYANGPILMPAKSDAIPDYEPLAFFRSELAENGTPKGVMVNSPAIARGALGKGRVIVISPHPEQTDGLEDFIPRAVKWLASPDPAKN